MVYLFWLVSIYHLYFHHSVENQLTPNRNFFREIKLQCDLLWSKKKLISRNFGWKPMRVEFFPIFLQKFRESNRFTKEEVI